MNIKLKKETQAPEKYIQRSQNLKITFSDSGYYKYLFTTKNSQILREYIVFLITSIESKSFDN